MTPHLNPFDDFHLCPYEGQSSWIWVANHRDQSNAQVMAHGIPTDSSNDKQNTGYLGATEMKKRIRARLSWVLQQYAVIKENQMAGQVWHSAIKR